MCVCACSCRLLGCGGGGGGWGGGMERVIFEYNLILTSTPSRLISLLFCRALAIREWSVSGWNGVGRGVTRVSEWIRITPPR